MHSHLAHRLGKSSSSSPTPSLSTIPPPLDSSEYSTALAQLAARILYLSPLSSPNGLPIYILNAATFPDAKQIDYDALLPYVLARLPGEEELIGGKGYEVIFFAGTESASSGSESSHHKKGRPGWGWFVQAYNVLTRATRKRLQALYIVHSHLWVRLLVETFSTIVSPKFRKKTIHCSSLTSLALHLPIENLLIPPSAYLQDRKLGVKDIHAPYATGRRAFAVRHPFPVTQGGSEKGEGWRLPRVLRETSTFILLPGSITIEGIFRVPALSVLVDVLREAYDRGQKFVVWKEDENTHLPITYPPNQISPTKPLLDPRSIDIEDAYPAYMAAALLKQWYAKLLYPVFPPSTYSTLRNLASLPSSSEDSEHQFVQFLSPQSSWSTLPLLSRQILVRHLLPLLSLVASHASENKMPARNLATCIGPSLLRGPDELEDAKMIGVVNSLLEKAISQWEPQLREASGVGEDSFAKALLPPENDYEYEDPLLEENRRLDADEASGVATESERKEGIDQAFGETTAQRVGVAPSSSLTQPHAEGDQTSGVTEEADPPKLPPRPAPSSRQESVPAQPATISPVSSTQRGVYPPRRSSLSTAAAPVVIADSPADATTTTPHITMSVRRKPAPSQASQSGTETGPQSSIVAAAPHAAGIDLVGAPLLSAGLKGTGVQETGVTRAVAAPPAVPTVPTVVSTSGPSSEDIVAAEGLPPRYSTLYGSLPAQPPPST